MEAQHIPLAPQSLCRILRASAQSLHVSLEARLLLYRIFERRVMVHLPQMLEALNVSIAADGILPSLTHVPIRARPRKQSPDAGKSRDHGMEGETDPAGGKRQATGRQAAASRAEPRRTHTAWLGEAEPDGGGFDEASAFDLLQQLLTGRRELLGKLRSDVRNKTHRELETGDVVEALGRLQKTMPASAKPPRNLLDIKRNLLARTRQHSGAGAGLTREDNDTFELLGMLYAQIEREIREDSVACALLRRLQLPLLQVALQDRAFFVRSQHPARQLLNAVAESGARWLGENDVDPQMLTPLQQAVEQVVEHYDGNPEVFAASNQALQAQLHTLARRAEMAEHRHVEAARGKEKLAIAKQRAADTIGDLAGEQRLPRFVRALLNQAWADVLTLTLLRHGNESKQWRQQLEITQRIVATCDRHAGAPDPDLAIHIERALAQVGYHTEEANVIARHLTCSLDDDDNDPASRTELAMKLKARARLGEDSVVRLKPKLAARNPEEQAHYDQLRAIPYGSWIEFIANQQGDVVRRRLSWYSPVTDNALFVNQRGQRIGEQSLDNVSRMLARGQARIVSAERGHLVDRAWQATLSALRSFAGHGDDKPDDSTADCRRPDNRSPDTSGATA